MDGMPKVLAMELMGIVTTNSRGYGQRRYLAP